MDIIIEKFTKDRVEDVLRFEQNLRMEEDFYGWDIGEKYISDVTKSFEASEFQNALSFLAYAEGKVVGRIDASLIPTHFGGSMKAYLDWICVIKSYRHCGVAQALMSSLRKELKQRSITQLIGLIASNEEAQRFYRSMEDALIRDEGIWIDIK